MSAGHQITADITAGLGLSYDLAEEMKKKYGTLAQSEIVEDETDRTVGDNGHTVSFRALCEIMQARVEEIIRLIMLDLPENKEKLIPAGIVITGGCANIPGIVEVAEKLTKMPARIGTPTALSGVSIEALSNPAYATSVGLILWSMKNKGTSNWFRKPRGIRGFVEQIIRVFR